MQLPDSNKMLSVPLHGGDRDRSAEGGATCLRTLVFRAKPQLSWILIYKFCFYWQRLAAQAGTAWKLPGATICSLRPLPPFGNLRWPVDTPSLFETTQTRRHARRRLKRADTLEKTAKPADKSGAPKSGWNRDCLRLRRGQFPHESRQGVFLSAQNVGNVITGEMAAS